MAQHYPQKWMVKQTNNWPLVGSWISISWPTPSHGMGISQPGRCHRRWRTSKPPQPPRRRARPQHRARRRRLVEASSSGVPKCWMTVEILLLDWRATCGGTIRYICCQCYMYMYVIHICIIYNYIVIYIYTYIHTYIHTYVRTYVHTYIHT